ncbi:MoaD/ThiS family protein [Mariniflexile jejuense]|uniref:MoaD/ThiS family protein n=1 Tax=Mariniflexile jejuense TaxID=1173582 RepID=A0ABW3JGG2_9FLAO
MTITIKYFGLIAEVTNCQEEVVEFSKNSIAQLLEFLNSKYPILKTKNFQVAQNQVLVSFEDEITGQEIALLPPFAGG